MKPTNTAIESKILQIKAEAYNQILQIFNRQYKDRETTEDKYYTIESIMETSDMKLRNYKAKLKAKKQKTNINAA